MSRLRATPRCVSSGMRGPCNSRVAETRRGFPRLETRVCVCVCVPTRVSCAERRPRSDLKSWPPSATPRQMRWESGRTAHSHLRSIINNPSVTVGQLSLSLFLFLPFSPALAEYIKRRRRILSAKNGEVGFVSFKLRRSISPRQPEEGRPRLPLNPSGPLFLSTLLKRY